MADFKIKYAAPADLTITLASLASSTTRLAGQESAAVDNTTNLYVDALVSGKVTTAGTLTANRRIEVWVYAQHDDVPTYMDVLDGSDSAETFAVEAQRNSAMRLGAMILLPDTTARTYWFAPFSVAALFGGVLPKRWGIWITQDSGAALSAAAADHDISHTGIHGQSV